MSAFSILTQDIILDEEAFSEAVAEFENLSSQLENLRKEIEDMMNVLKEGFNTPAGVKFINSCEKNLYEPLDAQKLVLEHISKTLTDSKKTYESVFAEYEALQNTIKSGITA